MEKKQFSCEKCGHNHYVSDQFQATGGNFAKIFDVDLQNCTALKHQMVGTY
jgi:predicted nucleic-acid-binding Zn-ribbon protein